MSVPEAATELQDVPPAQARPRLPGTGAQRWVALCVLGFLVLVALGITSSSISALDDPVDGAQGLVAGTPRPIRSDEWIRVSPVTIGESSGPAQYQGQALLAVPYYGADGSVAAATTLLAFPEAGIGNLLGRLRPSSGFSFSWWLPILLFWIALPLWLVAMGLPLSYGILAAGLIFFSPASAWWTYHPVQLVGWTALAALAALRIAAGLRDRAPKWRTALWLAAAAVSLGHLALSYLVWAIPVALSILVPTAVRMLAPGRRARALAVIGACALAGVALAAAFVATHSGYYEALAGTEYPAARSSSGDTTPLSLLLGGPFLAYTQLSDVQVAGTNLSEVSSGYTFLGLVALGLVLMRLTRGQRHDAALTSVGIWLAVATSWCTATWPPASAHLYPLSLVPPQRMAQVLFIPATILFVMALTALLEAGPVRPLPRATWIWLLGGATLALLYAGSQLRAANVPSMPVWWLWAVAAAWAGALYFLLRAPQSWRAMVPVGVLAVASSIFVNPVQFGFADLQTSSAARQLQQLSGSGTAVFAADDMYSNAILAANSIDTLTGQQWGGPDPARYRVLDPSQEYEAIWNRGASTVLMEWTAPGSPTAFANPNPDLIVIQADPCAPALRELGLTGVVANHPLEGHSCLTEQPSITISGAPKWVYALDAAG